MQRMRRRFRAFRRYPASAILVRRPVLSRPGGLHRATGNNVWLTMFLRGGPDATSKSRLFLGRRRSSAGFFDGPFLEQVKAIPKAVEDNGNLQLPAVDHLDVQGPFVAPHAFHRVEQLGGQEARHITAISFAQAILKAGLPE